MAYLFGIIIFLAASIFIARIVFALPNVEGRVDTIALAPATSGPIAGAVAKRSAAHPELSGIAALENSASAFAARVILANAAVSSIDAQYYIWRDDLTGNLLLDALKRAADRGVRVRLLLDDNGVSGLDPELADLDLHPNVEVRLYNPFNLRRFKTVSFTFDFFRLNRRMHNKSLTVDGHATILGGRNVGDEYFGTGVSPLFVDLDVLAVGQAVADVSADFDRYWAARSVYPASVIIDEPKAAIAADGLARFRGSAELAEYRQLLERSDIVADLAKGDLALEWTQALLVSDDPRKGKGTVKRKDLLATRLMEAVGEIRSRFDGVSPYLVPGRSGVKEFAAMQKRGVNVRMLTNSLEATDVLAVHAGYTKHRKNLLRSGVKLFELRKQAAPDFPSELLGPIGSSGSSLHAKTFAVDGKRIFVGSFNFDPRSTMLNTEMGLLINSPTLANTLHDAFDGGLVAAAWKMKLENDEVVWVDTAANQHFTQEPGSTALKRLGLLIIGWLPVEWLL